jgi:photoactive yellow protein
MNAPALPSFDTHDLARAVERLPEAAIHALPFGVVHLDAQGRIVLLNEAEARLSGYGARPTQGRYFFIDVAPCLATDAFLGRIEQARAAGRLDIELEVVGDFDDADKEVRYRIQSASQGGMWIFRQNL